MKSAVRTLIKALGFAGWRSYRTLLKEVQKFDPKASVSGSVFTVGDLSIDVVSTPWMVDTLAMYANAFSKGLVSGKLIDSELHVKYGSYNFTVRSGMEFAIVCEIFSESIYRVACPSEPVIVDIGANIGISACYFAGELGLKVYGYELVPEIAKRAQDHVERNGLSHLVQIRPAGLASAPANIDIVFDSNISGATTIYLPKLDTSTQSMVRCELLGVSEEIRAIVDQNPSHTIIVKMDCEGAEYEILECLATALKLDRISGFLMEYHNISSEKNAAFLEKLFATHGFSVHSRIIPGKEYEMMYAFRTIHDLGH